MLQNFKHNRSAFTMIELIFVIVVLGILAAVAIPKLAATRDDAMIAKGRSDVATIRSAIISERQSRLFRGNSQFISALDSGVGANTAGVTIFDNNGSTSNTLLPYGIKTGNANGDWMKTGATTYTFKMPTGNAVFTYTQATGVFDCADGTTCSALTD